MLPRRRSETPRRPRQCGRPWFAPSSSSAGFAPVVVHSLFGGLRFSSGLLPAFGGGVIDLPRLDPVRAARTLFLFPERRARLEIVHQKFRGRESRLAMRRR